MKPMSAIRWVLLSIFLLLSAAMLAAVLTPSVREAIQKKLTRPGREVLATAEGDVLNDGSKAKVIKYRDADSLFVEVMRVREDGSSDLVDRILLPDKHDGLFNYQGHVTRLAIADVNQDGKLELLAPSFDNQLVPHLNVFRFNPDSGRFEPFQH
jgi:hypothetical protein